MLKYVILIDLIFFVILYLSFSYPWVVEEYYSQGLYLSISKVMGGLTWWMKFSLTELVVGVLMLWFLGKWVGWMIWKKWTFEWRRWKRGLTKWVMVVSMVWILFYGLWGLNFFRVSLKEKLGMGGGVEFSEGYFEGVLSGMIGNVNRLVGVGVLDRGITVGEMNILAEEGLGRVFRRLELMEEEDFVGVGRIKELYFSGVLSKLLVKGFVNAYFHEGYYNGNLSRVELPWTISHEKVHLYGYSREGEANFLGYLGCKESGDDFMDLGGDLIAIRYFLNNLYRNRGVRKYEEYYEKLDMKVREIYEGIDRRIEDSRGWISDVHKELNTMYLKANQVEGGVADYGQVVFLILSYRQKEALK